MSDLALHRAAAQHPAGDWRRMVSGVRQAWLGLVEGFRAARRYERLAASSDRELARLGITRADLPWFALNGERRPG